MAEREIDRFDAEDDDGNRYTIIVLQEFETRRDVNGNLMQLDGFKILKLLSGEDVNRRQDGAFQIFQTGKIIRKVG
jgi:hypothetical protein